MEETGGALTIFIVLTVLLFMGLGIVMVILVDHKARLPGGFISNPFSIKGLRRDHPVLSFVTGTILLAIIASLVFEISVSLGSQLGLFQAKEKPQLLTELKYQRFSEKKRHFHNEPVENFVDMGKKQACFYCHGDYPHDKERMIRTLLNMHTQFIGCMTCHYDMEKLADETVQFEWLNYSGIEVSGPRYGTSNGLTTGTLVETDDYYSKIVIYAAKDTDSRLLELVEDNQEVREFAELVNEGELSDADREGLKRRFHASIADKPRTCSDCHTEEEKSYIPFRKLEFSQQRVFELTNLEIIGIVEKYRDFYLPDLMRTNGQHSGSILLPETSTDIKIINEIDLNKNTERKGIPGGE